MAYTRVNWQNSPSHATPLSAENLNVMDEGIKNLDDSMTEATGDISDLETTVSGHTTSITGLQTTVGEHTTDITNMEDDVSDLQTTVSGHTTSIQTNATNIATNTTAIGTLTNLTTTAKSNLVGAINEVDADVSDLKEDLSDNVSDLKSAIMYKTDNVYGGATTASYLIGTAGKTWHATSGTLVNNAKRAASEQIKFTPDMQKFNVPSTYRMIVYGNNAGIGNPLTQVSSLGVVTYNLASFAYKYIYIVIFKQDQSEIESDLTDVLSLSKYDAPLPFALVNDLTDITNDVSDNRESIKDIEEDIGVKHIILSAHKLGNFSIYANGEIAGATSTRVATIDKIPIWVNAPTYITAPSGFYRPILYLFKNGTFTSMVNNPVNGNTYDADEVRMLFFKNPNTQDITPQEVAAGFTMWQVKTDSLPNRISALENADVEHNDYSLIAYGDSLTTGAGASSSTKTYWAVCASQLSMKNRIGFGFGGSQSKAIAFTAGALSAYIPPNANTFKIKYADLESNLTIAANALNGKTVIVNGAEHTISQTSPTDFSLPDTYIPSNIYLPVANKNSRYTADVYVIWMGTNDNGMQWDLIDAMIAKLPHKKYVVMGLTRLGTDTSLEDEEKGYILYGSHYFNTRKQIINNAFAILGTTPTAEDTTAMNSGLMPPSLLVDGLHFNDSGYEAIGKLLAKHIQSLGYTFQIA